MKEVEVTQINRSEIYTQEFAEALIDAEKMEPYGGDVFVELAARSLKWKPDRVRLAIHLFNREIDGTLESSWSNALLMRKENGDERVVIRGWK